MLDLGILQHDGVLDTGAGTDDHARSDGDVRAQLGGGVDAGRGVDVDGRHDGGRGRGEFVGLRLECLLQVEGVGGDSGTGGLDLAPEVLGLVDEEAVAVREIGQDVLLQTQDLALLFVLGGDERRLQVFGGGVGDETGAGGATLDGAADGGENALGSEQVDAAVDEVGDMRLGLFDVVQHPLSVRVGHDAAEVGGGVVVHPGSQNHGLSVLLLEQLQHLAQRERAADVGVEHKDALRLALQNGIAEVVETAGGAQRGVFAQVLNAELREFLGGVFDEVAEDALVVIPNQNHFSDIRDLRKGLEAMVDDGVPGDFEQRLQIMHKGSVVSVMLGEDHGQNGGAVEEGRQRLTLGTSRERGLKRVPRDGPPT